MRLTARGERARDRPYRRERAAGLDLPRRQHRHPRVPGHAPAADAVRPRGRALGAGRGHQPHRLIGAGSTTYSKPWDLARRFATLDHISGGRAGWNIVTTGTPLTAANFGAGSHPEHADRYARAHEFVDVVRRVLRRRGHPALPALAAGLAGAAGRDPDQLLVLPALMITLGGTEAEAKADQLDQLTSPEFRWQNALYMSGLDPDGFDPDAPLPPELYDGRPLPVSGARRLYEAAREHPGLPLRELAGQLGGGSSQTQFAGTPEQLAEHILASTARPATGRRPAPG